MATDVERLIVRLEASAAKFERDMARAAGVAKSRAREMEKSIDSSMGSMVSRMQSGVGDINKAMAGIGLALSTATIAKYADEWLSAANKIKAAGIGQEEAEAAREKIAAIAAAARVDFSETAALYARLTRSTQQFGASQDDVVRVTETVAKAIKLSGASASEASATLTQLSQALQSGTLAGDELRSLLENAPVLAQSIAREFGVAVGELKNLGSEGKLVSDRVFKALLKSSNDVDAAFRNFTPTIADSFKALETAAIQFVGTSGQVNAATALIGKVVLGLSNNFGLAATGATALGVVLAGRLIAAGLAPLVAQMGAASLSSGAAAVMIGRLGAASGVASLAVGGLSVALRLLGGPVGAAVTGLVAAVGYLTSRSQEGAATASTYARALQEVDAAARGAKPSVAGLAEETKKVEATMASLAADKAKKNLVSFDAAARDLQLGISALVNDLERFGAVGLKEADKKAALDLVSRAMNGSKVEADAARMELQRMGDANPSFANAMDSINSLLKELAVVRQAAALTGESIARIDAAGAAAADRRLRAAVPDPTRATSFEDDAAGLNADPVVRALKGQGVTNRAVIEAEYSKTEKEFNDKKKALVKTILEGGGAVPGNIDALTKRILAGEEARSGGGGKSSKEKDDAYEKEIKSIERRTEALQREAETVGKGTFEIERSKIALELEQAAKKANVTITDEVRAAIDAQAAAYARAKVNLENMNTALQTQREFVQFLGSNVTSYLSDLSSGGKNASEAFMHLAKRIAEAGLQAALLGQGPLAKLLGLSGQNGDVGGLLGGLFKAFSGFGGGATGAPMNIVPGLAVGTSMVPKDMLAQLHKGEIVVPKYDADMLRAKGGGGSGNITVTNHVDLRGSSISPADLAAALEQNKRATIAAIEGKQSKYGSGYGRGI